MRRVPIVERGDWRAQAAECGFRFHTIGGERYWDERAYYAFTLRQIEDDIDAGRFGATASSYGGAGGYQNEAAVAEMLERLRGFLRERYFLPDCRLPSQNPLLRLRPCLCSGTLAAGSTAGAAAA